MHDSCPAEDSELDAIDFNETGHKVKVVGMKFSQELIMLTAEFIGTAMLVFFGCIGCIDWGSNSTITAPLNFGLVVMFLTQIFGHFSYAVYNPAVTVAASICKIISIKLGIFYVIIQLSGATIGYGLLQLLIPSQHIRTSDNSTGLCVTTVNPEITTEKAFLVEFFLTSALILISCSHWDPNNRHLGDSVPLRMGLTVAGLGITGGKLTGASMNPARTFGPALLNWHWENQWIYWIGPLSSAILSSILYKFVFWDKNPKKALEKEVK